ncbi:MAG: hypothetical protein JWN04_6635 [Myxococcaceae bacterium]|nr:hypothetical protein [Myxococcaceae bacterium]
MTKQISKGSGGTTPTGEDELPAPPTRGLLVYLALPEAVADIEEPGRSAACAEVIL